MSTRRELEGLRDSLKGRSGIGGLGKFRKRYERNCFPEQLADRRISKPAFGKKTRTDIITGEAQNRINSKTRAENTPMARHPDAS